MGEAQQLSVYQQLNDSRYVYVRKDDRKIPKGGGNFDA